MTLLVTIVAALISTIIWYLSPEARKLNIGLLCSIYWGAGLMWLADSVFEYLEIGTEIFHPSLPDMLNDTLLGVAAITFGVIIWLISVLIKDPKNNIKSFGSKSKSTK